MTAPISLNNRSKRPTLLALSLLAALIAPIQVYAQLQETPRAIKSVSPQLDAATSATLQQVRLDQELANHLLKEAIAYEMPKLAYAAIRRGADSSILHTSPICLQHWDFLQLHEYLAELEGKTYAYSPDCWEMMLPKPQTSGYESSHLERIVQHLISKGVNINTPDSKGQTALSISLKYPTENMLNVVLAAGGDPTLLSAEQQEKMQQKLQEPNQSTNRDRVDLKPLYKQDPYQKEYNNALRALYDALKNLNVIDKDKEKELATAMELVNALPTAHAQEIKNKLLHTAVQTDNLPSVKYLLEEDCDVSFTLCDQDGRVLIYYPMNTQADMNSMGHNSSEKRYTVLAFAMNCSKPNKDVICYLLAHGAQFLETEAKGRGINACDRNGWTPLMHHLMEHQFNSSKRRVPAQSTLTYLDLGADVKALNNDGINVLFYAAHTGALINLQILVDAGADVNCKPIVYVPEVVYRTICSGNLLGTFLLLESGAYPCQRDNTGKLLTPSIATGTAEERERILQLFQAYRQAWLQAESPSSSCSCK